MNRIAIIGPPCSGKSTIGRLIGESSKVPFFSMGDIYRQHKADLPMETVLRVDNGGLMTDEEAVALVKTIFEMPKWILDGFPRTKGQARFLLDQVDVVLSISTDKDTLWERFQMRRVEGRSDDTLDGFTQRLAIFEANVKEIEGIVSAKLVKIHGSTSQDICSRFLAKGNASGI